MEKLILKKTYDLTIFRTPVASKTNSMNRNINFKMLSMNGITHGILLGLENQFALIKIPTHA